jgi:two-component system CheB/CheR fusion protein
MRWTEGEGPAHVAVTAKAVTAVGQACFLLAFNKVDASAGLPPCSTDAGPDATLEHLDAELRQAREDLKAQSEEMESANEELRASNEEMMSMNEELQATNEELETTKEELQALNEELTTVNNELNEKLHELEAANNDLINFLSSTETATILLDLELRIRRFTPATRALVNLLPTDVGRPLADLVGSIGDTALLAEAAAVIQALAPLEREFQSVGGRWYLRRIIAYRTHDHRIDGAVVTFPDITHTKANEAARAEDELRSHLAAAEAQAAELTIANQRLRELDVLKSDFLATASHELRTPLTSIVGFTEFLEDELVGPLTPGQREHVQEIAGGAQRLQRLVSDMLDFAWIEAGNFRLEVRDVDVIAVVKETLTSLQPQIRDAGITLVEHLPEGPLTIVADPERI